MANFTGTPGNDTMPGTAGADNLTGLAGDDRYTVNHVGDAVFEANNGGFDRVLASLSWVLTGGSWVEMMTTDDNLATTAINLTGNALSQHIYGNAGSNRLDGGGGGDVLVGLEGNDFYTIRNAADRVVESSGGGTDRVLAAASFTLEANSSVEMITTIDDLATAAINLTGNNLAQNISGNAGSNRLDGGGGGDIMTGLGGNDFYTVRNAADRVVEAANAGSDRIFSAVSYTLEANSSVEIISTIDNLATTAINLTGNNLAQYFYGNAGANTLDGNGGGDVMLGFEGNDIFYIRNSADRVVEVAGAGTDRVFAAASFTLEAGSEVEILATIDNFATTAINLTGNNLNQHLYGNAGANTLDGKAGNDVMIGLGGADSFAFTSALGAGNVDRITDFQPGIDRIRLGGNGGEPFAALAAGNLVAGAFRIGAAAVDANDYLIYNSATGALLYDADGNGAGAAVQFAILDTAPSLTAAAFIVSGPANHAPVVTSATTATVVENSATSTIVYQAQATDADGDRISWSLGGTDVGRLTIDANGAVRLISAPDFEAKSSYSFSVTASDSGSSSGARGVTLSVTDVNENQVTPIINETSAANDSAGMAQGIDRATLVVATNPNLFDDALPSATIAGSVATHADKDYFSITLQAGELLVLDVDGTNALDSHLRLYGGDGIQIGDNDDPGSPDPGSNPPFDHNTDSLIRFRAATGGTYYFSIEAFQDDDNIPGNDTSGSYRINVSVGPPATPQQLIQEDVEALSSGTNWNDLALTYGFPTMADQYPQSFTEPDHNFTPFSAPQQAATRLLLQLVANVTPLTFAELSADPGNADLRYGMSDDPDVAYAYYPTNQGPSDPGGTAWFNHTDFNSPVRGNYAWMGILHETGHALGLKHGHEFPLAISADRDSVEYSVMTYRSYPGQDLSDGGGYTNETWGYPQTLMMYDIAALQQLYGANFNFNAGNSVYSWSPTTGQMSINGVGQGTPGGNRVFMTVWDGGGTDTYDLSNYANGSTIDLRPGEWSTTSQTQIANLGQGHMARGNVANALLFQASTTSLIENAIGGSGHDTLIANQAANHLTGGANGDVFKWMSSGDAGTGSRADTIMDFQQGTDQVHLLAADAIPGTPNNDDFIFIGTEAFSNSAGELRYQAEGGNARIQADLDGNGTSDFEIIVNGVTVLTVGDFFF